MCFFSSGVQIFRIFTVFVYRYRFENFTGSNFVLMKLRINDVEENDYGEYGCFAENSEGSGENFVRLLSKFNQTVGPSNNISVMNSFPRETANNGEARPTIKKFCLLSPDWPKKNFPYPKNFIGLPEKDFFYFMFSDSSFSVSLHFPSKMLRMCWSK